jgi:hypothetical protein
MAGLVPAFFVFGACHSGARAISAFTRVFDALWPANPEFRHNDRLCNWIPGSRLSARPGMTAVLILFLTYLIDAIFYRTSPFAKGAFLGATNVDGERRLRSRFAIVIPGGLGGASRRKTDAQGSFLTSPGSPAAKAKGARRASGAPRSRREPRRRRSGAP